jgi:hypothetical protein
MEYGKKLTINRYDLFCMEMKNPKASEIIDLVKQVLLGKSKWSVLLFRFHEFSKKLIL